jgi:hypothetical protein
VRRRADGAAVDRARPHAVERAAVVVHRAAEEPVGQAEFERDDVGQGEDGDLRHWGYEIGGLRMIRPIGRNAPISYPRHGRILSHVGFRATV